MTLKKATFAAGCFWGVEARFMKVKGVAQTEVGYMGGHTESPTYRDVCTDRTGHAEVVQLTYDDSVVSYDGLLDVFWSSHDPTQRNRQGPDVGTQYRTAIFYHDEEQRSVAERSKATLDASGRFKRPIATLVERAGPFWKAEEYHQKYLQKKGLDTCHI
ncbi:MAG TPA: peptide-methionine (S)-S-oxide reductase MsrA [Methanomassiliicoccales archaeon]|nr:peptide-methionine (S)-S-oxide reductase MsrA [Methanomassiliicoccales archaeon]HNX47452.1 peptide-methionine (S)-S-oxide reductase MsrA [Methanomassiliicoccales archaeon]HPR98253.1 peptide-methionine (S)-S-oxide reductase MsrA [Methanomassiliicoccales archaeon]